MVIATIAEGFDRTSPVAWGLAVFLVWGGLFFIRCGYRFIVVGPELKTVVGKFSIRANSRQGLVARALLLCAMGLVNFVGGLVIISDMLYGWP